MQRILGVKKEQEGTTGRDMITSYVSFLRRELFFLFLYLLNGIFYPVKN